MLILLLLATVVLGILAALVHPAFIIVGGFILVLINQRRIRRNARLAREKRAAQRATATTPRLSHRDAPVRQPLNLDPSILNFFMRKHVGAARPADEICRIMRRYGHKVTVADVVSSLEFLMKVGLVSRRTSRRGTRLYRVV